jgi:hypothetical protein
MERQLLKRRFAEFRRHGHHSEWRKRHHPLQYLLVQRRHVAAPVFADGAAEQVDLSGLSSGDASAAMTGQTSSIFPDATTSPDVTEDGASGGSFDNAGGGTLTLSGGSIPDTSRVTVDAGGSLQLFSTSDWSFDAKFDDEFASDTNKAEAGGTFQLFSAPSWSFTAKLDGEFAPQPQLFAGSGTLNHTW